MSQSSSQQGETIEAEAADGGLVRVHIDGLGRLAPSFRSYVLLMPSDAAKLAERLLLLSRDSGSE